MNSETVRVDIDQLFDLTHEAAMDCDVWLTMHHGNGKTFGVMTFLDSSGDETVLALAPQPKRGPQFGRLGLVTELADIMKPIKAACGKNRKTSVLGFTDSQKFWEALSQLDGGTRAKIAFLFALNVIEVETARSLLREPKVGTLVERDSGFFEIDFDTPKSKRGRKAASEPVAAPKPAAPPKPKTEKDNPAWGLL